MATGQQGVKREMAFLGAGLVGATALFWLCWQIVGYLLAPPPPADLDLSDQIAAASALFSALSFVALVAAVYLQHRELGLQRTELSLTRQELKAQRDEMQGQREQLEGQYRQMVQQSNTLRRQVFENTLFQLLGQHNAIVASQTIEVGNSRLEGRAAFYYIAGELAGTLANRAPPPGGQLSVDQVYDIFTHVCESPNRDFSHYSRNLYYILRFIDESNMPDPTFYAQLVRAQLSQSELILLAFNGLRRSGRSRLKAIIERHQLLNNLPPVDWVRFVRPLYGAAAFGSAA